MVKCNKCGKETGDDIPECQECADKRDLIGYKAMGLKKVKSLSSFGAVIEGEPDLKKGAEKLVKELEQ